MSSKPTEGFQLLAFVWRWTHVLPLPKTTSRSPRRKKVKKGLIAEPCPTLCDPMDCSPPDSSVRGTLQARILEWVAVPSSRRMELRVTTGTRSTSSSPHKFKGKGINEQTHGSFKPDEEFGEAPRTGIYH